jgi:ribosomal protein S27AE
MNDIPWNTLRTLDPALVLERLNVSKAREKDKWSCPSCGSSDALHNHKDHTYCFSCQGSFNAVDLAEIVHGISAIDAAYWLGEEFQIAMPERASLARSSRTKSASFKRPAKRGRARSKRKKALRSTYDTRSPSSLAHTMEVEEGTAPDGGRLDPAMWSVVAQVIEASVPYESTDMKRYFTQERGFVFEDDDAWLAFLDFSEIRAVTREPWQGAVYELCTQTHIHCPIEDNPNFHALQAAGLLNLSDKPREGRENESEVECIKRTHWVAPYGYDVFLVMPYFDMKGALVDVRFRRIDGGGHPKMKSLTGRGAAPVPYLSWLSYPFAKETGILFVVEGEMDALALCHVGIPAIAVPGASAWKPAWCEDWIDFEHVVCWADHDKAGAELKTKIDASVMAELGLSWRTQHLHVVTHSSSKDANEVLIREGKQGLLHAANEMLCA